MSEASFVANVLRHDAMMNLIYAVCALCIIYNLAVLGTYLAQIDAGSALVGRVCCLCVGTVVFVKMLGRFQGGDVAQWLDIYRELSWCGLLYAVIMLVRRDVISK
jgi:hypothetical protein